MDPVIELCPSCTIEFESVEWSMNEAIELQENGYLYDDEDDWKSGDYPMNDPNDDEFGDENLI